jgi:hypothetical protein
MRKITSSFLIFMMVGLALHAQTEGELSVSVTTSSAGGNYAPRNIVALWVEDANGNFVKTLLAYADKRISHLNTWQASTNAAGSEFNKVDAISGATKSSHATRTCQWDGSDFLGNQVSDGTYYLWMELTDKNATGNFSSFAFSKGNVSENSSPEDTPSFSSVSIAWEPTTATDVSENTKETLVSVFPNPGNGVFKVNATDVAAIEVFSITGKLIYKSSNLWVDLSSYDNGVYLFKIETEKGNVVKRVIKK